MVLYRLYDHATPKLWPSILFHFDSMNYSFWDVVERETNRHCHSTITSLKTTVDLLMPEINKYNLVHACHACWWFLSNTENVIEAEDGFIKKKSCKKPDREQVNQTFFIKIHLAFAWILDMSSSNARSLSQRATIGPHWLTNNIALF